jgi:hypothetical protein
LDLEYDDCPATCAEGEEVKKGTFCDECPVKTAKDGFRDYCEETLENVCPGHWRKFGFDSLKRTVEEISSLEGMPRVERSLITHRLIQELAAARNRFEKISRQNEKETE